MFTSGFLCILLFTYVTASPTLRSHFTFTSGTTVDIVGSALFVDEHADAFVNGTAGRYIFPKGHGPRIHLDDLASWTCRPPSCQPSYSVHMRARVGSLSVDRNQKWMDFGNLTSRHGLHTTSSPKSHFIWNFHLPTMDTGRGQAYAPLPDADLFADLVVVKNAVTRSVRVWLRAYDDDTYADIINVAARDEDALDLVDTTLGAAFDITLFRRDWDVTTERDDLEVAYIDEIAVYEGVWMPPKQATCGDGVCDGVLGEHASEGAANARSCAADCPVTVSSEPDVTSSAQLRHSFPFSDASGVNDVLGAATVVDQRGSVSGDRFVFDEQGVGLHVRWDRSAWKFAGASPAYTIRWSVHQRDARELGDAGLPKKWLDLRALRDAYGLWTDSEGRFVWNIGDATEQVSGHWLQRAGVPSTVELQLAYHNVSGRVRLYQRVYGDWWQELLVAVEGGENGWPNSLFLDAEPTFGLISFCAADESNVAQHLLDADVEDIMIYEGVLIPDNLISCGDGDCVPEAGEADTADMERYCAVDCDVAPAAAAAVAVDDAGATLRHRVLFDGVSTFGDDSVGSASGATGSSASVPVLGSAERGSFYSIRSGDGFVLTVPFAEWAFYNVQREPSWSVELRFWQRNAGVGSATGRRLKVMDFSFGETTAGLHLVDGKYVWNVALGTETVADRLHPLHNGTYEHIVVTHNAVSKVKKLWRRLDVNVDDSAARWALLLAIDDGFESSVFRNGDYSTLSLFRADTDLTVQRTELAGDLFEVRVLEGVWRPVHDDALVSCGDESCDIELRELDASSAFACALDCEFSDETAPSFAPILRHEVRFDDQFAIDRVGDAKFVGDVHADSIVSPDGWWRFDPPARGPRLRLPLHTWSFAGHRSFPSYSVRLRLRQRNRFGGIHKKWLDVRNLTTSGGLHSADGLGGRFSWNLGLPSYVETPDDPLLQSNGTIVEIIMSFNNYTRTVRLYEEERPGILTKSLEIVNDTEATLTWLGDYFDLSLFRSDGLGAFARQPLLGEIQLVQVYEGVVTPSDLDGGGTESACGDGYCSALGSEFCDTCPDDCGDCCGDGLCNALHEETCESCRLDCGPCCGNGVCEPEEIGCDQCLEDCAALSCCPPDAMPLDPAGRVHGCRNIEALNYFEDVHVDATCEYPEGVLKYDDSVSLRSGGDAESEPLPSCDASTLDVDIDVVLPDERPNVYILQLALGLQLIEAESVSVTLESPLGTEVEVLSDMTCGPDLRFYLQDHVELDTLRANKVWLQEDIDNARCRLPTDTCPQCRKFFELRVEAINMAVFEGTPAAGRWKLRLCGANGQYVRSQLHVSEYVDFAPTMVATEPDSGVMVDVAQCPTAESLVEDGAYGDANVQYSVDINYEVLNELVDEATLFQVTMPGLILVLGECAESTQAVPFRVEGVAQPDGMPDNQRRLHLSVGSMTSLFTQLSIDTDLTDVGELDDEVMQIKRALSSFETRREFIERHDSFKVLRWQSRHADKSMSPHLKMALQSRKRADEDVPVRQVLGYQRLVHVVHRHWAVRAKRHFDKHWAEERLRDPFGTSHFEMRPYHFNDTDVVMEFDEEDALGRKRVEVMKSGDGSWSQGAMLEAGTPGCFGASGTTCAYGKVFGTMNINIQWSFHISVNEWCLARCAANIFLCSCDLGRLNKFSVSASPSLVIGWTLEAGLGASIGLFKSLGCANCGDKGLQLYRAYYMNLGVPAGPILIPVGRLIVELDFEVHLTLNAFRIKLSNGYRQNFPGYEMVCTGGSGCAGTGTPAPPPPPARPGNGPIKAEQQCDLELKPELVATIMEEFPILTKNGLALEASAALPIKYTVGGDKCSQDCMMMDGQEMKPPRIQEDISFEIGLKVYIQLSKLVTALLFGKEPADPPLPGKPTPAPSPTPPPTPAAGKQIDILDLSKSYPIVEGRCIDIPIEVPDPFPCINTCEPTAQPSIMPSTMPAMMPAAEPGMDMDPDDDGDDDPLILPACSNDGECDEGGGESCCTGPCGTSGCADCIEAGKCTDYSQVAHANNTENCEKPPEESYCNGNGICEECIGEYAVCKNCKTLPCGEVQCEFPGCPDCKQGKSCGLPPKACCPPDDKECGGGDGGDGQGDWHGDPHMHTFGADRDTQCHMAFQGYGEYVYMVSKQALIGGEYRGPRIHGLQGWWKLDSATINWGIMVQNSPESDIVSLLHRRINPLTTAFNGVPRYLPGGCAVKFKGGSIEVTRSETKGQVYTILLDSGVTIVAETMNSLRFRGSRRGYRNSYHQKFDVQITLPYELRFSTMGVMGAYRPERPGFWVLKENATEPPYEAEYVDCTATGSMYRVSRDLKKRLEKSFKIVEQPDLWPSLMPTFFGERPDDYADGAFGAALVKTDRPVTELVRERRARVDAQMGGGRRKRQTLMGVNEDEELDPFELHANDTVLLQWAKAQCSALREDFVQYTCEYDLLAAAATEDNPNVLGSLDALELEEVAALTIESAVARNQRLDDALIQMQRGRRRGPTWTFPPPPLIHLSLESSEPYRVLVVAQADARASSLVGVRAYALGEVRYTSFVYPLTGSAPVLRPIAVSIDERSGEMEISVLAPSSTFMQLHDTSVRATVTATDGDGLLRTYEFSVKLWLESAMVITDDDDVVPSSTTLPGVSGGTGTNAVDATTPLSGTEQEETSTQSQEAQAPEEEWGAISYAAVFGTAALMVAVLVACVLVGLYWQRQRRGYRRALLEGEEAFNGGAGGAVASPRSPRSRHASRHASRAGSRANVRRGGGVEMTTLSRRSQRS